jgi:chloride channel protein, CIC family
VASDRCPEDGHYRIFCSPRLGVGYDTIGGILNANLALKLLLVVMVAKGRRFGGLTGSGTSGGLLAPMYISSAAMSGAYAMAIDRIYPGAQLAAGALRWWRLGAVFGVASRATFTFIIFAFEITHDSNSVLPLMLVSVIADGIAMRLMPKYSIMTEKLVRRGMRVHMDYETDVLEQVSVEEMMDRELPTISSETLGRCGFPKTMLHHFVFAMSTIQAPSQESFPEDGGAVAFNGITPMFSALSRKRFSR